MNVSGEFSRTSQFSSSFRSDQSRLVLRMDLLHVVTALSALFCLANAAPHNYYGYGYAIDHSRFGGLSYTPTFQYQYQQPLGYHSNAFVYPSAQNVIFWTPTVVGHSKQNDGKTVGDDTVTIIGPIPVPVQDVKSEAPSTELEAPPPDSQVQNDAVVVDAGNRNGNGHGPAIMQQQQPSFQLQLPAYGQGQTLAPIQFAPFGFAAPPQYALPTVGWIPNTYLPPQPHPGPAMEVMPPGTQPEKVDDETMEDDTVKIEGPTADDDAAKDMETKIAESNPEENEMMDGDAPQIDDIQMDDDIVVAPQKPQDDSDIKDDGATDYDAEKVLEKELEDE